MELVQRLRDWEDYEPAKMFGGEILKDTKEAADEIERLRAALREIAAYDDKIASRVLAETGSYRSFDEPGSVSIARAALEQGGSDGR